MYNVEPEVNMFKYLKIALILFVFFANSYLLFGQIPQTISYQGVLTDQKYSSLDRISDCFH